MIGSMVWARMRSLLVAVALAASIWAPDAWAHEARPAYLEITETAPGRYDVLWRIPVLSGMRLPVMLRFPDDAQNVTEPAMHELSDSLVERGVITASGGNHGLALAYGAWRLGLPATVYLPERASVDREARIAAWGARVVRYGTAWNTVGVSVFGASMITLYLASTLYHALTHDGAKRFFRVLDHSAIFILIAGTLVGIEERNCGRRTARRLCRALRSP